MNVNAKENVCISEIGLGAYSSICIFIVNWSTNDYSLIITTGDNWKSTCERIKLNSASHQK